MTESISLRAAAATLSVCERTIKRLGEKGLLSAFKVGSSIRITKKSIDSYVAHMILVYSEEHGIINLDDSDGLKVTQ